MKTPFKVLAFAIITILCMEMLFILTPAHAVTTTLELVNPIDGTHEFNFTTAQKSVGDTFTANLTITNVALLGSWQARITWDPTLLDFVDIAAPSDSVFSGIPGSVLTAGPDTSTPGSVLYGQAIVPPSGKQSSFNGTGTLAVLTLRIIQGVSSSGLRQVQCAIFLDALGIDTFILNSQNADISFIPINGHYTYTAPPPPPASLYINPPKVVDPGLIIGTQFNVSLSIANATNVNTWGADILYDNTILSAIGVEEGDFLSSVNLTSFSFTIQQDYNATHGLIRMNCTLSSGGANGNGNLSTIIFQVLGLGQSAITITNVTLLDSFGISLPFSTTDGYFNNILMAKLSVIPPEVTGPLYVPGTTFTINVTLEDVQDFRACIFNLTYVPSVIREIAINVPSVQGQIPIKKLQVDDGAGYIWANITFPSGITTFAPVTLMTVQFQVLAMGISPLNLTDTELYDVADSPIIHEVFNGIFIGIIRDVAVTNVTTDLQMAYQGWNVSVNVTVKNKGNMTETFGIHFYFDANLGGSTTVVSLVPDEERVVPMTWITSTVQPCHNYTISATADPVPYEINLADNNFTDGNVKIRWMGDVNGDGRVDMRDIAQLILVFNTYPGKPGWNPEYDLNRDGRIDMRDIVLCVLNFNKACP